MKWIKPDSITKKSVYLILGIGLVVIFLVQLAMPSIFYHMMGSQISENVANVMRASTISQSYIWRGSRIAFTLYYDQDVQDEIFAYSSSDDETLRNSLREKILSKLETQQIGQVSHQVPGEGAIVATSFTMIYTENGDSFYQDEAAPVASVLLDSGWLSTISPDMDMIYSPVLGDDSLSVICFVVPFSACGINCYAIHLMDFTYIRVLFQELENMGIHDFCILQDDRILYQNTDYPFPFDSYPEYMYNLLQYQTSVLYQKNCMDFMTLVSYEEENMKIVVHADRETLLAPYHNIILIIECLISLIIFLLVILISLFIKQLLKRLKVLSQRIERVIDGNYTPLPEDYHNDEIGKLTQNFNRMVQTIQTDIEHRIAQEKKEQQMQYSLLVSAIDPHFIYNTLNTITFLAHMGKTTEIAEVNTALIGTLKDRLAIKNCKTYDTIETEKEILSQYMLIQSYLCHNTIAYSFDVSEADQSVMIPKNILQPLVENSIKHGLLPHKDPNTHQIQDGKIWIRVERQEHTLTITIEDNGIGISKEIAGQYFDRPLAEIPETEAEHIGIYNIRKRLSYLYGDQYTLTAQDTPGGGCTILLNLLIS